MYLSAAQLHFLTDADAGWETIIVGSCCRLRCLQTSPRAEVKLLRTPVCRWTGPTVFTDCDGASSALQHALMAHPRLPVYARTSSSMRPALGLCALSRPSSSSVSSASISSAHDSAPPWTRAAKESASSSRDACQCWRQVEASTASGVAHTSGLEQACLSGVCNVLKQT